ncbi:MAG: hypothetical protein LAT58_02175 [Opitutales bacterium]|nr:hypothetical protein [Opitutales bacterium]
MKNQPLTRFLLTLGGCLFIYPALFGSDYIQVEITYEARDQEQIQIFGELHFETWPLTLKDGQKESLTPRTLRATEEGQISFQRESTEADPPTFTVVHRRGEMSGSFSFQRIPVLQSDTATAERAMDRGLDEDVDDFLDIRLEDEPEDAEASFPVRLEVNHTPEREFLQVDRIASILVLVRPDDEPSPPTGRFVQYNRAAKGSSRVQLQAATFFGGSGDERFLGAVFSPAGDAIWAGINLRDGSFVSDLPHILPGGTTLSDPTYREATASLVQYSPDLESVNQILRFPENSARIEQVRSSRSGDAAYVVGRSLANFGELVELAEKFSGSREPSEDPLADFEGGRSSDQYSEPGTFIARISDDGTDLLWLAWLPGVTGVNLDFGPEETLLLESRRRFWHLTPEGELSEAPSLEANFRARVVTPIAVSPVDGSFYLGGEYHSGTGLEPWRNPFLHRFKPSGQPEWTAWNWTGPLVGVQWSRQVSDSAVRQVLVEDDGQLLIRGWSDGGNSVFTNHPYDFRKSHGKGGFAGSIWGANVLSVSYLMRMDPESMEITAFNRWLSYMPSSGTPNAANIRDFAQTENREVVFTGSSAASLIETHNAFVEPWYLQHQRDPSNARPKGGPYVAIFDHDFKNLLLSTSVPGLRHGKVHTRGQDILLSGETLPLEGAYGINLPPIIKNAPQDEFGGGSTDAYLMLITVAP